MLENKYVVIGATAAGGLLVGGLATGYVARRNTKKLMKEVDASLNKLEKMTEEAILEKEIAVELRKSAEKREEALKASLDSVVEKTSAFTDNLREDFKDDEVASAKLATRIDELASDLDTLANEWEE